jgi:hypothetical protein
VLHPPSVPPERFTKPAPQLATLRVCAPRVSAKD